MSDVTVSFIALPDSLCTHSDTSSGGKKTQVTQSYASFLLGKNQLRVQLLVLLNFVALQSKHSGKSLAAFMATSKNRHFTSILPRDIIRSYELVGFRRFVWIIGIIIKGRVLRSKKRKAN